MIYQTQGFVFKKKDLNDSDRTFSIFTHELGRVEVFAKAIRKIDSKLRSGIDLLCLSEIEFFQGKRKTLTDAKIIQKFNSPLSSLEKFRIVLKISEVINKFVKEEERDEKLFNLIGEIFEKLETANPKELNIIFYYFIWNFLSIQGKFPEIEKCILCKDKLNPDLVYFSIKEDSVICQDCQKICKDAKKINSDIIKLLRLFTKKDWQTLSKLKFEQPSQKLLQELSKDIINNFY